MDSRIRGVCFYSVTSVVVIFLVLAMVTVHPGVMLFDRHRRRAHHLIAKVWATLSISPFYRFKFEGMENLPSKTPHPSSWSPTTRASWTYTLFSHLGGALNSLSRLAFSLPVYWVGNVPHGCHPSTSDGHQESAGLSQTLHEFGKKRSICFFFFPEGTRSKDRKLGAFKRGAFSVAAKTGAHVVPITLMGTGMMMPAGMEGILNSGSVKVVIHKSMEGKDADVLCNESRNVIANTLLLHGFGVHCNT